MNETIRVDLEEYCNLVELRSFIRSAMEDCEEYEHADFGLMMKSALEKGFFDKYKDGNTR